MQKQEAEIEAIFHAARAKRSRREREAYLDGACGEDLTARARVQALLDSDRDASGFLVVDDRGPGEAPGTVIGNYKLLQLIGEGGFGTVYMAEQDEPVKRKVALKIIKLGMDTKQVVARFESERQALAIMDHPRIAKVFDAGVTDRGRPYFVMEYVPGIPITEYCDMRSLDLRERLGLFVQACEAIEHAHRKGIIHRDIKPSNLLVAVADGKPSLKVIDFGVAKATSQRLTERTLFTQHGMLIGTPGYMSPEQAGSTPLEVDSRTDIYALGVLLYEMLVGALPFGLKMLKGVALVELLRIIREEDPPTPVARVASLGAKAEEVAKRRHLDVRSLARQLNGELEWITMRALEKDPARRYATAADFASDVGKYLANEPVAAGPPSFSYRLRKFVIRHKVGVVGGVAASILVAAFSTVLAVQSRRLDRALEETRRSDAVGGGDAKAAGGMIVRKVWAGPETALGSPSPDGRFLSFVDWDSGDLALRDLVTNEERRITHNDGWSTGEFAEFSIISPDGERVAYSWFNGSDRRQLRVIDVDGSRPRLLIDRADVEQLWPLAWFPDGRSVLAQLILVDGTAGVSQIVVVSVEDGDVRELVSGRDLRSGRGLSPDGRHVAYSRPPAEGERRGDIYVVSVEEGEERALVAHPAADLFLGWAPSGQVLFTSDRRGSWDGWCVEVVDGERTGDPVLVQPGLGLVGGPSMALGFAEDGSFYYALDSDLADVYVAPLDPLTGGVGGPATRVTEAFSGPNAGPTWSSHGEELAFLADAPRFRSEDDGGKGRSHRLVRVSMSDGETREVGSLGALRRIFRRDLRWSPDGSRFLIAGRGTLGRGLFTIDAETGEVAELLHGGPGESLVHLPEWSPDGESVYFSRRVELGISGIFERVLATGEERRIVDAVTVSLALSPDGRWIVYTVNLDDGDDERAVLVVTTKGGGEPRTLVRTGAGRSFPLWAPLAWTPDGEHVLVGMYAEGEAPGIELWRIAFAGGEPERMGLTMPWLFHVRVHPDGDRIALQAGERGLDVWVIENFLPETPRGRR